MRPWSSLLVLVAACGAPPAARPPSNHAAVAVRPRCAPATLDPIAARLRARWQVDALELRCAAGYFGADGLFLEARGDGWRRTGVVDASGAALVPFVDEPELEPGTFVNGYRAADLDGDGDDEIVESWRRDNQTEVPDSWLVIRRVAGGRFVARIHGPYVSRFHPDLDGGCSARWELARNALVMAVERRPGIPPTECLEAGLHRFALRGNQLMDRRIR